MFLEPQTDQANSYEVPKQNHWFGKNGFVGDFMFEPQDFFADFATGLLLSVLGEKSAQIDRQAKITALKLSGSAGSPWNSSDLLP